MALPTTKITVKQVRDTLGETTLKVTELCTSPKINEWSPYLITFKTNKNYDNS